MTTTSRYRAVIYDCDGVILDSLESNYIFYNRIMEKLGRPEIDREDREAERVLHTYSFNNVMEHFFDADPQKEEAYAIAATIRYRELMPFMRMEEGFRETLNMLRDHVSLAICTNRATSMEMIIEDFGLEGYFLCIMTAAKVQNPKPHPEPLIKVLEYFDIKPDEALFIGDSEVDMIAARNAGVPFIAYKTHLPVTYRINHHSGILPHVFGQVNEPVSTIF